MLSELSIESLRDRTLLLRSLPAFAQLGDDTLSFLAEQIRLRRYRPEQRLLTLGEPIHHVYIVLEGCVRWQRKGQATPSRAQSQQVVGWLTLMARDPHGMDAVVESETLVAEMPAEMLEHALEEDFAIVRNMLRMGAASLLTLRGELPYAPERRPVAAPSPGRGRRRTLVERLIDMRRAPIFRRTNIEALVELLRRSEDVEVEAGHVFWRRGELAAYWIVIESGHVHCENAAGRSVDVDDGFVVGIMDAIAQRPRSYEARAETRVVANRIELETFLGVLETHTALAREMVAMLAQNVLDGG